MVKREREERVKFSERHGNSGFVGPQVISKINIKNNYNNIVRNKREKPYIISMNEKILIYTTHGIYKYRERAVLKYSIATVLVTAAEKHEKIKRAMREYILGYIVVRKFVYKNKIMKKKKKTFSKTCKF